MNYLSNSRTILTVPIDDVKPYQNNVLSYPKKQLQKIEALIRKHNQLPTILVTADLTIISGEEWWRALKNAGKTEVKVEVLADLSPADVKAVRLALGRLPLDARLDRNRLRAELASLQAEGIDLDLSGYDSVEIAHTFEVDMPRPNAVDKNDLIPPRQDRALVRLNDTFELGRHYLGCADLRDGEFVGQFRRGRPTDVCITSLRFNAGYLAAGQDNQGGLVRGSRAYYDLVYWSLEVLQSASAAAGLICCFTDQDDLLAVMAAARRLGMPLSDIAVWTKANPELEPDRELRGFYRSAHELCLVFKAGERPHLKDVKPRRTNVWNHPAPVGVDGGVHPTAKPVALISEILLDCTKPGDLVLDTMIGAGSTLIAAEETGRTCIGVELDPYYVEVAIRRWQDHTGKHAVHLQTGQLFDDLAQHLLTHQGGQHGGA